MNELMHKTMRKTAGKKIRGNRKEIPFELSDLIKWSIICEACYLVLDERFDKVKEIFKDE